VHSPPIWLNEMSTTMLSTRHFSRRTWQGEGPAMQSHPWVCSRRPGCMHALHGPCRARQPPAPHLCVDDLHVSNLEDRCGVGLALVLQHELQLDGPGVSQRGFRREDRQVDVTIRQVSLQRHAAERARVHLRRMGGGARPFRLPKLRWPLSEPHNCSMRRMLPLQSSILKALAQSRWHAHRSWGQGGELEPSKCCLASCSPEAAGSTGLSHRTRMQRSLFSVLRSATLA
jgi:hypothetical protein